MTPWVRIIATVLTVLSQAIVPCLAQDDPPPMPQAAGSWRIDPVPEKETKPEKVSAVTSAIGNTEATFSLWCKPDVPLYYFVIRDARLAKLEQGAEVTIAVREPNQEPVRFAVASPGDGSVIIQERVHQPAFSSIMASLAQEGAQRIALAIDEHQWAFPLDGFAALMPSLTAHCGFAPDPRRGAGLDKPSSESDTGRRNPRNQPLPRAR